MCSNKGKQLKTKNRDKVHTSLFFLGHCHQSFTDISQRRPTFQMLALSNLFRFKTMANIQSEKPTYFSYTTSSTHSSQAFNPLTIRGISFPHILVHTNQMLSPLCLNKDKKHKDTLQVLLLGPPSICDRISEC